MTYVSYIAAANRLGPGYIESIVVDVLTCHRFGETCHLYLQGVKACKFFEQRAIFPKVGY